jgi:Carboxypeptidase regulatory-like domain
LTARRALFAAAVVAALGGLGFWVMSSEEPAAPRAEAPVDAPAVEQREPLPPARPSEVLAVVATDAGSPARASLRGRVIDSHDHPIEGAMVSLAGRAEAELPPTVPHTDAAGAFAFPDLAPGLYELAAIDFKAVPDAGLGAMRAMRTLGRMQLDLPAGKETAVELRVQGPGTATVRVIQADGGLVPSVQVGLSAQPVMMKAATGRTAVSGADGLAVFPGLLGEAWANSVDPTWQNARQLGVAVAPGKTVELVVAQGSALTGHVVDAHGVPLKKFEVNGHGFTDGNFRVTFRPTFVNPRRPAKNIKTTLTIGAEGFATLHHPAEFIPAAEADLGTITLSRGRQVRVRLTSTAGPLPAVFGFMLTTRDDQGIARVSGSVASRPESPGVWVLEDLPETSVELSLRLNEHFESPRQVFSVPAGQTQADARVALGATLKGTVRSAGVPVPAAAVMLGGRVAGFAEDDGTFQLVDVAPGPATLECMSSATRGSKKVEVPASGVVTVDCDIQRDTASQARP